MREWGRASLQVSLHPSVQWDDLFCWTNDHDLKLEPPVPHIRVKENLMCQQHVEDWDAILWPVTFCVNFLYVGGNPGLSHDLLRSDLQRHQTLQNKGYLTTSVSWHWLLTVASGNPVASRSQVETFWEKCLDIAIYFLAQYKYLELYPPSLCLYADFVAQQFNLDPVARRWKVTTQ